MSELVVNSQCVEHQGWHYSVLDFPYECAPPNVLFTDEHYEVLFWDDAIRDISAHVLAADDAGVLRKATLPVEVVRHERHVVARIKWEDVPDTAYGLPVVEYTFDTELGVLNIMQDK